MPKTKAIAFYLPQYHPIPENDQWWGKGFTEWTNVTRARSLFRGHYQPHLPADLGFYDLRLRDSRIAQAELAKAYGIAGFCYYHYWFNGRRILERPFDEVLESGEPDFPFCLCWANENWTRRWDGHDKEILLEQRYCDTDDLKHIRHLLPALHDTRYIRIDEKPLLLIYRVSALPTPARTLDTWRTEAERSGLKGLYICNVECFHTEHALVNRIPLDSAIEFAPDWSQLPPPIGRDTKRTVWDRMLRRKTVERGYLEHSAFDYQILARNMVSKPAPTYARIPCVTPMWDNSARRRKGATILINSTPEIYESWLRNRVEYAQTDRRCGSLLFINAWNEWAEGNHLEPCQRWGRQYLEATKRALSAN